jgi:hypothetical protein
MLLDAIYACKYPLALCDWDAVGCFSYSMYNKFDDTVCTVMFHHHLCQLQDFFIDLTHEDGLLFTDAFGLPVLLIILPHPVTKAP